MAVPAGLLPRRRWQAFDSLPIEAVSLVSALVTLGAGMVIGARGFLVFLERAADGLATATFDVATRQAAGGLSGSPEVTSIAPMAFSALSLPTFLIATPLGWLTVYLVTTGTARGIGALVGDPAGDPIVTGLDWFVLRAREGTSARRAGRARERLEGPEVPDRLYPAGWADVDDADFVVVASRRKPDWTPGTFVITADKWYTIGIPSDLKLPEGLRTVYPLTEQKVCEVLRRGVRYRLPPLRACYQSPGTSRYLTRRT